MCYGRRMAEVASRELRNNTRAVLDRVEAGEVVVITVDGRPIARLEPIGNRPRWMSKAEWVGHRRTSAADPGLTQDLRDLAPDTTDDLDLP
jgi:prevent-host-death family protein